MTFKDYVKKGLANRKNQEFYITMSVLFYFIAAFVLFMSALTSLKAFLLTLIGVIVILIMPVVVGVYVAYLVDRYEN